MSGEKKVIARKLQTMSINVDMATGQIQELAGEALDKGFDAVDGIAVHIQSGDSAFRLRITDSDKTYVHDVPVNQLVPGTSAPMSDRFVKIEGFRANGNTPKFYAKRVTTPGGTQVVDIVFELVKYA